MTITSKLDLGKYSKTKSQAFQFFHTCFSSIDDTEKNKTIKCEFLADALSSRDLSKLTHNTLSARMIEELYSLYPTDLIQQSSIISIGNYNFVLRKDDLDRLTDDQYAILSLMTETTELHNPVYVEIDDHGKLIVD